MTGILWVADYRFERQPKQDLMERSCLGYSRLRSDQDITEYSDLQSTDPEVCFALLQGTEFTDVPITDYTEVQIQDYGRTDGGAVKCDVMDALLAKQTTRLYFTDYRWRCHEV